MNLNNASAKSDQRIEVWICIIKPSQTNYTPHAIVFFSRKPLQMMIFSASRHHKGDPAESDHNLLCWEIDFASATSLQSSKFVSKSLQVK